MLKPAFATAMHPASATCGQIVWRAKLIVQAQVLAGCSIPSNRLASRLNPVEIAVDVELQQHRRMIRRPTSRLGSDPVKSKLGEVEFLDKCVDHPDRIVLADPVLQAFRKQRALPAIRALNEAPHLIPPQITQESYRENQMKQCIFTQARSGATDSGCSPDVRFSPESDRIVASH
jgi:hypothetical protein